MTLDENFYKLISNEKKYEEKLCQSNSIKSRHLLFLFILFSKAEFSNNQATSPVTIGIVIIMTHKKGSKGLKNPQLEFFFSVTKINFNPDDKVGILNSYKDVSFISEILIPPNPNKIFYS